MMEVHFGAASANMLQQNMCFFVCCQCLVMVQGKQIVQCL